MKGDSTTGREPVDTSRSVLRAAGLTVLLTLTLGIYAALPVADAAAKSRICRQLEAQLAASNGGGSGARKYDQAIERQRRQMAIARGQARDAGCGFAVFGRKVRQCAGLAATIDRMQDNLDGLERTRDALGGGSGGRPRSRILASLNANGCRDDGDEMAVRRPLEEVVPVRRNRSLIDQLFGNGDENLGPADEKIGRVEDIDRQEMAGIDPDAGDGDFGEPDTRVRRTLNDEYDDGGAATLSQTYATMCVRTCDGYFFPMSPKSTQGDFSRDQKNCESACPGAEMQIFYRPSDAPEESDMTSAVSGLPYSRTATAYNYRNGAEARPATCGCNVAKNFKVVAGKSQSPKPAATEIARDKATASETETASLPAKPSPGGVAAPETEVKPAPDTGSFTTPQPVPLPPVAALPPQPKADDRREIDRSAQIIADQAEKAEERKVRVVGPVFLPDPGAAIDLRAPDQKKVR